MPRPTTTQPHALDAPQTSAVGSPSQLAIDNPFPGPQPYRGSDRARFYGREAVARRLASTILAHRCVALFGPTDPRRTSPAGDGHRVLASGRWCSPCFRRRCPLLHHGCMKDLEVEAVTAAAVEALGLDRP